MQNIQTPYTIQHVYLQVLSLHRHLSDPKHRAQIGAGADQSTVVDVIVLTVGDGVHKLKLLLAPGLNKLVQTCKVSTLE